MCQKVQTKRIAKIATAEPRPLPGKAATTVAPVVPATILRENSAHGRYTINPVIAGIPKPAAVIYADILGSD
jgi:hypothetical protein